MSAETQQPPPSLEVWRSTLFEEMGFTEKEAKELSEYRGSDGKLIDVHVVRRAVAAGCSKELALKIFL